MEQRIKWTRRAGRFFIGITAGFFFMSIFLPTRAVWSEIPSNGAFDSPWNSESGYSFEVPKKPSSETVSFTGKIIPVTPDLEEKAAEYCRVTSSTGEKGAAGPIAFLVVRGEMAGRHLYSLTQPNVPGGYPTKIGATPIRTDGDSSQEFPFLFGPFTTASEIVFEEFLGETLEKLEDHFTAIAPVFSRGVGSETESLLNGWRLDGSIDALCCDDANCKPVKDEFPFVFDSEGDLASPLAGALKTAAILNGRLEKGPADEEGEGGSSEESAPPSSRFEPGARPVETSLSDRRLSEGNGSESAQGGSENRIFISTARHLFYAFFGGMILNIMPCVLPVIGLKIVSFFEQAGQSRSRAFILNLFYSGGILSVFTVLALMSVGLSYLFTYGLFQIVMGGIVFVMALNLMGVWEITLPSFLGGSGSNRLMQKEGGVGAWFKGVITTLLAIPCGAPLLSPALVWTDAMIKDGSIFSVLMVYWVIGLGMAAPFLLIGAFPELLKFLPKPGLWMETFRNVMGFILLAAIIWILYSMPLPLILPMITFLFSLWFACWFLGRNQFDADRRHRRRAWSIALAVVTIVYLFSFNLPFDVPFSSGERRNFFPTLEGAFEGKLLKWGIRAQRNGELTQRDWPLFDQAQFESDLAAGKTVMIDFTADWCMNCKVLESTILHTREILEIVNGKGIVTMTADWTNRDESAESRDIGRLLRRFGGEQVPVLMIFSPDRPDDPIILRGMFTKGSLIEVLETVGE